MISAPARLSAPPKTSKIGKRPGAPNCGNTVLKQFNPNGSLLNAVAYENNITHNFIYVIKHLFDDYLCYILFISHENDVIISLSNLCTFQILGGCQGRRTGVAVTTVSSSLILGGWVTKVLKNGDKN